MKKKIDNDVDEMRPEYDLTKLKFVGRGIYAERYRSGTNIVLLDRDVRKAFPDDREINDTLREVARARQKAARAKKPRARQPSRSPRVA